MLSTAILSLLLVHGVLGVTENGPAAMYGEDEVWPPAGYETPQEDFSSAIQVVGPLPGPILSRSSRTWNNYYGNVPIQRSLQDPQVDLQMDAIDVPITSTPAEEPSSSASSQSVSPSAGEDSKPKPYRGLIVGISPMYSGHLRGEQQRPFPFLFAPVEMYRPQIPLLPHWSIPPSPWGIPPSNPFGVPTVFARPGFFSLSKTSQIKKGSPDFNSLGANKSIDVDSNSVSDSNLTTSNNSLSGKSEPVDLDLSDSPLPPDGDEENLATAGWSRLARPHLYFLHRRQHHGPYHLLYHRPDFPGGHLTAWNGLHVAPAPSLLYSHHNMRYQHSPNHRFESSAFQFRPF